jgi:hypothetical protein
MVFRCEDLPQYGLVLVPPAAPEYDGLVADIEKRLADPVAGSPPPLPARISPSEILPEDRETSAILLNRSSQPIAAIQQVWTFVEETGRTSSSSIGSGTNASVLLPFGLPQEQLKLYGYWHTILPGSKRYFNAKGEQIGDNSDVRPPTGDEVWRGGIGGGGGGGGRSRGPMKAVTFTLDGVFFADGGFAGPNQNGLWEQVTIRAEAQMQVAHIARDGHNKGMAPAAILSEIEKVTGPASERIQLHIFSRGQATPEQYRANAFEQLAWQLGSMRKFQGDERTVFSVMAWTEAQLPRFHRL